jgi:hypothetical protein
MDNHFAEWFFGEKSELRQNMRLKSAGKLTGEMPG